MLVLFGIAILIVVLLLMLLIVRHARPDPGRGRRQSHVSLDDWPDVDCDCGDD